MYDGIPNDFFSCLRICSIASYSINKQNTCFLSKLVSKCQQTWQILLLKSCSDTHCRVGGSVCNCVCCHLLKWKQSENLPYLCTAVTITFSSVHFQWFEPLVLKPPLQCFLCPPYGSLRQPEFSFWLLHAASVMHLVCFRSCCVVLLLCVGSCQEWCS